ncbi:hypothetical protein [Nocardia wallacei]|uniref:hypothetical protein n=1 Tax=Nocardia wallacei TaxID=480035 RepID=UPI002458E864|nr:hypothetical protein [Nocardia wallacei]
MTLRKHLLTLAAAVSAVYLAVVAVRTVGGAMPGPVELTDPAWWRCWADTLDPPPVEHEHQDLDHHPGHSGGRPPMTAPRVAAAC